MYGTVKVLHCKCSRLFHIACLSSGDVIKCGLSANLLFMASHGARRAASMDNLAHERSASL